jgi:hypothetical protein
MQEKTYYMTDALQKVKPTPHHTHHMGGCKYNAILIISRHNNTFKLLHDLIQTHNGGRWPILIMDLGNKQALVTSGTTT